MDVKIHAIPIEKNDILYTFSVYRATPVPSNDHMMVRVTLLLDLPAQTSGPRNTDAGEKEPLEYVADKVVHDFHTSEDLVNKVGWYGYTPEKDTREPASYIPRHILAAFLVITPKSKEDLEMKPRQLKTRASTWRETIY